MKKILSVMLLTMVSFNAFADTSVPADSLRDNTITRTSEPMGEQFCNEVGLRVPTIRELAMIAQSMGARGIRETAYPGMAETDPKVGAEIEQMKANGYTSVIEKMNSTDQLAVDFYYNPSGYVPLTGTLDALGPPPGTFDTNFYGPPMQFKDHYFFSSTDVRRYEPGFVYTLRAWDGGIQFQQKLTFATSLYPFEAVHCVR